MVNDYYNALIQKGYKLNELYDMTVRELIITLEQTNKGMAYKMWREASLIGALFSKQGYPKTPEDACPELYPPKKTYKIPDFLLEKAIKRGVI